jgi:sulfite reductase (NADPH) hemoprotein beta-component
VIGPSFFANEIPKVITNLINTYVEQRTSDESFIETYHRLGVAPFKEAAYKNALNKNDKHAKESNKSVIA